MDSIQNNANKYKLAQITSLIKKYRDEPLLKTINLAKSKGATEQEISTCLGETLRSYYRLTRGK